jgi:sulfur-oxidizing protein SoxZ
MAAPIRIRIRRKDGITEVTVLLLHPMETGMRRNAAGRTIPAHYITDATVSLEGRTILEAQLSIAVSKDPLLTFRMNGGTPGETIRVAWRDNRGEQQQAEAVIPG